MTHFIRAISAIIAASDSTKISRKETEDLQTQPNSKKKASKKKKQIKTEEHVKSKDNNYSTEKTKGILHSSKNT